MRRGFSAARVSLHRRRSSVGGSPARFYRGGEASISRGTASSRIGERGARWYLAAMMTCSRSGMPLSGSSNDPWNSVTRAPNCSIKAPPCLTRRRIFRTRDRARILVLLFNFPSKINRSYFFHHDATWSWMESIFLSFFFLEMNTFRQKLASLRKLTMDIVSICSLEMLFFFFTASSSGSRRSYLLWYEKFLPRSLVTTAPCWFNESTWLARSL